MKQNELFGSARWLGFDGNSTPAVRADFTAPRIRSARITICGLGMFEAYINGTRVSEDLFVPAVSDYVKSEFTFGGQPFDEEMRHRVYALEYDITPLVKEGRNSLAVLLGPGFFSTHMWCYDTDQYYGDVRLIYRISWTDENGNAGEYVSDTAKWHEGEITECNFFKGENHDLNILPEGWMTDDVPDWKDTIALPPLDTEYFIQTCPADRIERFITPRKIASFVNVDVYDIGENVSALVYLEDTGKKGELTEVFFSELITPAGGLLTSYGHGQYFRAVSSGSGKTVHPNFTWNAFRYFSVCGTMKPVKVAVVHSDVKVSSSFKSSSPALNWLYEAYVRTQLANMHGGIPSDCPHLERRGYTGDGELTCETAMLALDAKEFYKKWIQDIYDCQDSKTGHVQYTAPYTRCGGGPGGWGCAVAVVPWKYYLHYGEKDMLESMYAPAQRYIDYLVSHSENDLVTSDRPGAWCLGDWCCPGRTVIPPAYVNSWFLIKTLDILSETEKILGLPARADRKDLRERVAKAIVSNYFDDSTGSFCGGIQGADAFAVDIGLGDARTLKNLVSHYENIGQYDTGIFGTEIVTRVLFEKGCAKTAFGLMDSDKPVSFSRFMRSGLTTLPEYWPGDQNRSLSHPMFGAVAKELFKYVLGIRQNGAGWTDVVISPAVMDMLPEAEGFITVPAGVIAVKYGQGFAEVTVPGGIKCAWKANGGEITLSAGVNRISL